MQYQNILIVEDVFEKESGANKRRFLELRENSLHLDLFGIEKYCTFEELPSVILHEMHHLLINKMIGDYQTFAKDFSLLEKYIFRFTGEGLAIKFCNNAEGVISKRIDKECASNVGLASMKYLNSHFDEHFELFCSTAQKIVSGQITEAEVNKQFRTYWWNPYLYKDEVACLDQTPIYSFGNELFGCIYDAFGLDVMFDCFYNPLKTIHYFNRANCGYSILM